MNAPIQQSILALAMFFLFGLLTVPSQAHTSQQDVPLLAGSHPGGAYLVFAGKFGGDLEPEAIQACKEVQVAGCAVGSKIFQFTLRITHNGKTTIHKSKDGILSEKMLNQLASLEVGDVFKFEHIKAHLPKGGEVDVHARKFTVV